MERRKKMKRRAFTESPIIACFFNGGERSQGRVHSAARAEEWIGAKRRPLTAEGRQPLSFLPDTLQIETGVCGREMQQSQMTTYAAIAEVRMPVQTGTCNQLLAAGWVLLGIYP